MIVVNLVLSLLAFAAALTTWAAVRRHHSQPGSPAVPATSRCRPRRYHRRRHCPWFPLVLQPGNLRSAARPALRPGGCGSNNPLRRCA